MLHCYLRGLGIMNVVFAVTVFVSLVRLTATLLLVPEMQMEGVFLGQLLSWCADALASVILYLCFYRTEKQIERVIRRCRSDTPARRNGGRHRAESSINL